MLKSENFSMTLKKGLTLCFIQYYFETRNKERETEKERQSKRDTEREIQKERYRKRDREREIQKERQRKRDKETEKD